MADQTTVLTCTCREVALEVQGKPIISAECLCSDCQRAGVFLQSLPGAPSILDQRSATRFVLFRKDRILFDRGLNHLREHRLSENSTTRRVVATCCNSPGHVERVDRAKYMAMKAALLSVLPKKSPGITVAEAKTKLLPILPQSLFPEGAKAGWWLKATQLDLEAKGVIQREDTKPLRLCLSR